MPPPRSCKKIVIKKMAAEDIDFMFLGPPKAAMGTNHLTGGLPKTGHVTRNELCVQITIIEHD